MRRVTTWLGGIGLALFLLGLSVAPLTIPAFTNIVASRTSLAEQAGLSQARTLQLAEQVRQFVVDNDGAVLPTVVDGRPGFDADASSHLLDVARVLRAARVATGVLALAFTLGIAWGVARRQTDRIAGVLSAGAFCSVAIVVLAGLAATMDFEAFFSAFHGLFFSAGTWTFPYDSLLIQLFPETFWVTAGVVWAGLVLAGAGVLALGASALRRAPSGDRSAK